MASRPQACSAGLLVPGALRGERWPCLHPVFALTGVLHSIGGPLLPSLAATFHLTDSQSGFLFLAYFAGTSLGALLCGAQSRPLDYHRFSWR